VANDPGAGLANALRRVVLPALVIAATAADVSAQSLVTILPGSGEIGVELHSLSTHSGADRAVRDVTRQAWLSIPVSGALVDPRFFSYSIVILPTWSRAVSHATRTTAIDSRLLARDISAHFSPVSRFALYLNSSRSQGNSGGSESSNETRLSTFNTGAQLNLAPIHLAATLTERSGTETWSALRNGLVSRRDFADHVVRLTGQSTKTSIVLERTSHDDRIGSEDFGGRLGSFSHTLSWGKGSSLGSSLELNDRVGGTLRHEISWSEQARLQHARTFYSDWHFRRFRSRDGEIELQNDAFGAGVAHQAAAWLRWGLHGGGQSTAASSLRTDRWSLVPDVSLAPPRAGPFRLSADARVGFEHERWDGGDAAVIPVFTERHTVGPTRAFVLDNPDVDSTSVVVRDATQSAVYSAPDDYEWATVGAFTEIRIPVTSRIRVGDVIVIGYRFRLETRRDADFVVADWGASVGMAAATLRHRQTLRSKQSDGGTAILAIPDFDEMTTELEVQPRTRLGHVRLDAARRARSAEAWSFTVYETGASLTPPAARKLQSSVSARWSQTRGDGERQSTLTGGASVSWDVAERAQASLQFRAFRARRENGHLERSLEADLQTRWCCGGLDMQTTYAVQWRDVGSHMVLGRWSLRATRRY
jgi:hypothetical protein